MKSVDLLEKARELLARGNVDHAESKLLDAIEHAAGEDDEVTLTKARLALGELLHTQGRDDEADGWLRLVIRTEREDGSVREEVKRSAVVLAEIRGWRTD